MKIEEVKQLDPLSRLVYWITEREAIRLKKEGGEPKPWSDDEILRGYRFCNARRADDKVSRWLLENWYTPHHNHPNTLYATCLARFFNQPYPTLAGIEQWVFPPKGLPKWDSIVKYLHCLRAKGEKLWNAAYMVRGNDSTSKVESVVYHNVKPLADNPIEVDPTSMRRTWARLKARHGYGSFMAGQIVADLRWALTGTWVDKHTWAPMGPGSARGLNRVCGFDPKRPMKQREFLAGLRQLIDTLRELVPASIADRLEAIDWQNALCESDKHCRVLFGEGRPKQLYNGGV